MPRKKFDVSTLPKYPDLKIEKRLWKKGYKNLGGIDEAGRGALAGPVSAAVVILPNISRLARILAGVRDSKQMTVKLLGLINVPYRKNNLVETQEHAILRRSS